MKKNHTYWDLLSPLIIQNIWQKFRNDITVMMISSGKKEYETLIQSA